MVAVDGGWCDVAYCALCQQHNYLENKNDIVSSENVGFVLSHLFKNLTTAFANLLL